MQKLFFKVVEYNMYTRDKNIIIISSKILNQSPPYQKYLQGVTHIFSLICLIQFMKLYCDLEMKNSNKRSRKCFLFCYFSKKWTTTALKQHLYSTMFII